VFYQQAGHISKPGHPTKTRTRPSNLSAMPQQQRAEKVAKEGRIGLAIAYFQANPL
jgi:hypothetical protein